MDNPTDRRVIMRFMVERFGFSMLGKATVTGDEQAAVGGQLDASQGWPISFWFGGWDPELLCCFMEGSLVIPRRPTPNAAFKPHFTSRRKHGALRTTQGMAARLAPSRIRGADGSDGALNDSRRRCRAHTVPDCRARRAARRPRLCERPPGESPVPGFSARHRLLQGLQRCAHRAAMGARTRPHSYVPRRRTQHSGLFGQ